MSERESKWLEQPQAVRDALVASWGSGVPSISSALYARWWQLETWLRSLVYVELRAAYGTTGWADQLGSLAEKRQAGDQDFQYMETPDAQARLVYTDARVLCEVISKHWDLFSPSLLTKAVWPGRVEELLAIRNRIGHCRRPHGDDLGRLEQALRDLEAGALRATSFFHERYRPTEEFDDPLVRAWLLNEHLDASLVGHADRQYETTFQLHCSRRPWAERVPNVGGISGKRGFLWHAVWYFRRGGHFNLRRFWDDLQHRREPIIFVCADSPHSLEIAFSAIDEPSSVANTIGHCFHAALENWRGGPPPENLGVRWYDMHADLDPRVQTLSAWTVAADPQFKISMFSA